MPIRTELLLSSLLVEPALIPATKALKDGLFDGGIIQGSVIEFQATLDQPSLTPKNFSLMIQSAFRGIVKPKDIPFDTSEIDQRDQVFAQQFGYVIRHVASARFVNSGAVEAWVGPALIHRDHQLASLQSGNNVYVKADHGTLPLQDILVPPDQIISAHYMRLTVKDEPLVLANLAQTIADQEINICEVRQPEQEVGPAEIAFLLDPCKVERVNSAVLAISQFPACLAVNAVHKVIGNPTQDISRKQSI